MKQWRLIYLLFIFISFGIFKGLEALVQPLEKTRIAGGLLPITSLFLRDNNVLYLYFSIILGCLFLSSWKLKKINSSSSVAVMSILFTFLLTFTIIMLIVNLIIFI